MYFSGKRALPQAGETWRMRTGDLIGLVGDTEG